MNTSPDRSSYMRMMKQGRYRAFRNLPVGWVLQSLHSTDVSDRIFRIFVEVILYLTSALVLNYFDVLNNATGYIVLFVAIHTISWFLMGNFWVYMLDSFTFVKNTGLNDTVRFIRHVSNLYQRTDSCEAILVYGSFCRNKFHIRSDIDLRIIRRTDSPKGLITLPLSIYVRIYSFFMPSPLDLQIVDSMQFLEKQMRSDEQPVVVYKRDSFDVQNEGISFSVIEGDPEMILRDKPNE